MAAQEATAKDAPNVVPPHATTVRGVSLRESGFTPIHLKTSGCVSAASLPKTYLHQLLPNITDLLTKAITTTCEVLEATRDALFLFPTLVLVPQKSGAASSTVKSEMAARIDLWNKGKLEELASRAKILNRPLFAEASRNEQLGQPLVFFTRTNLLGRLSWQTTSESQKPTRISFAAPLHCFRLRGKYRRLTYWLTTTHHRHPNKTPCRQP